MKNPIKLFHSTFLCRVLVLTGILIIGFFNLATAQDESTEKISTTKTDSIDAQNKKIQTDTLTEYDYWNYGITCTIQGGIWKPLGSLQETFSLNPNIGFKWGFPITRQIRIAFGASINIPIDSEPFDFFIDDSTHQVNSQNTANGIFGFWIGHETQLKEKYFFDKYIGIGVGFIQTDKKKENPSDENDNLHSVQTINLNFGIAVRRKVFRKRSLGFFLEYNYAPYHMLNRVKKDFGNSYLLTGITYRF